MGRLQWEKVTIQRLLFVLENRKIVAAIGAVVTLFSKKSEKYLRHSLPYSAVKIFANVA